MISKVISLVSFFGVHSPAIVYRFFLLKAITKIFKLDSLKVKVFDYDLIVPLQQGGLTAVLAVFRGRELDHKYLLEKELKPNDTILDLGSNIGYYATLKNRILNGEAKFYCIEPDSRNIKYLKKNIDLHKMVSRTEVTLGAISDYTGTIAINFNELTNLNSAEFQYSNNQSNRDVPCYDIVDFIKKRQEIDVIRMDIEGHELVVLKRLSEGILKNKIKPPRIIIFETHKYNNIEKAALVLKTLLKCGYKFAYVSSDDELSGIKSTFRKRGLEPEIIIDEWMVSRGIYKDVEPFIATDIISNWKGSRTVCLRLEK